MHDYFYSVPTSEQNDRYVSWGIKSISQAPSRASRVFRRRNLKDTRRLGKTQVSFPVQECGTVATSTSTCAIGAPAPVLCFEHPEEVFQPNFPPLVPVEGMCWLQAPAKPTHHDTISCATPPLRWVSPRWGQRWGRSKGADPHSVLYNT